MGHLKPCPFCGSGEVSLWYRGWRKGTIGYAKCDVCGAQTRAFSMNSSDEEIANWTAEEYGRITAAWNTRVDNREVARRLEEAIANMFNEKENANEKHEGKTNFS